jgi:hypothetical protein
LITGILVVLAIIAGIAAVACGAISGVAMENGERIVAFLTGWFGFGLMAAALALMWWAK